MKIRKLQFILVILFVTFSLGMLSSCGNNQNNLDYQYKEAKELMDEQEYSQAIEVLTGIIEKDSTYVEAKRLIADAYYRNNQYVEAKKNLYELIDNDAGNEDTYITLYNILSKEQKIDESVAVLNEGYEKLKNSNIKNQLDDILKSRRIVFYDKVLEKFIREKINKPEGAIYQSDLTNIKELYIFGESTNKVNEDEDGNYTPYSYSDILGNQYFGRGKITDIRDLKYLINIENITIAYQNIKTVPVLTNLNKLSYMNLNFNFITNINGLKNVEHLEYLKLSFNNIKDLTPLRNVTELKQLYLFRNMNLKNIRGLESLTNLEELNLNDTSVNSLQSLKNNIGLKRLNIGNTRLVDFTFLQQLTNLTYLNLSGNNIKELPSLKAMTNLQELILSYNQIVDLTPLEGLVSLKHLEARSNKIKTIPSLEGWNELAYLSLAANSLEDISGLSKLKKIKYLSLSYNNIKDISPLINNESLETLYLNYNQITDASPLRNFKNLKTITIDGNDNIKNLHVLLELENLESIDSGYSIIAITGNVPNQETISNGNLANDGYVISDGSYIYYQYYNGEEDYNLLYRRNITTNEDEAISGTVTNQVAESLNQKAGGRIDEKIAYLNISDNKLYFYSRGHHLIKVSFTGNGDQINEYEWVPFSGIMVMSKDGSDRKLLKEGNFSNIEVVKDTIYYLDENQYLNSMMLDGTANQEILTIPISTFYVINKNIYYVPKDNPVLLRYDLLTGDFTENIDEEVKNPIFMDGKILYINSNNNIINYNMDTKEKTQLGDITARAINISDNYLFYVDYHNKFLYRADLNGESKKLLTDGTGVSTINVLGDYIFFKDIYSDLWKIKYDGTEYEALFIPMVDGC